MHDGDLQGESDLPLVDLSVGNDLLHRFQSQVRQEIATHLAEGRPVYGCGLGQETGVLYMRLPDGRRVEYRYAADGTRQIVRDIAS